MGWGTNLLNGIFSALFGDEDYSDESSDEFFSTRKPADNAHKENTAKNNSFRYDPLDEEDVPEGQYTKDTRSNKYTKSRRYTNNSSNYSQSSSNDDSKGFKYYDASDSSSGPHYSNQDGRKSWDSSSNKQNLKKDRSNTASQGFKRQHASRSQSGINTYPTLSSKYSKTVKNDRASLTFGEPHFSTYDHGVRGIAFPYTLKVNNPRGRKIVVSGKFCTASGTWIKSLIPGMADRYGDIVINESVVCIDSTFNVDSYLFLPYGVLDLKQTQKIFLNIDVFVDGTGPQHLLRYVHGFEYYIYENDPREPGINNKTRSYYYGTDKSKETSSSYSSSSSYKSSSSSSYSYGKSKTESNSEINDNQAGFDEIIGLVAHIIKADGVCAPEEIRAVIDHFKNFNGVDKDKLKERLKHKLSNPSNIEKDCETLKSIFNTQTKLTIIALFFKIAVSDQEIPSLELELIEKIASLMGINKANYNTLLLEFLPASDKVWHVFGLTSKATKEQLKKAYRAKCKEWHPDKFANASKEEYKKAEEKFKELQELYGFLLRKF